MRPSCSVLQERRHATMRKALRTPPRSCGTSSLVGGHGWRRARTLPRGKTACLVRAIGMARPRSEVPGRRCNQTIDFSLGRERGQPANQRVIAEHDDVPVRVRFAAAVGARSDQPRLQPAPPGRGSVAARRLPGRRSSSDAPGRRVDAGMAGVLSASHGLQRDASTVTGAHPSSLLSILAPPVHTPMAVPMLVRKKLSSVRATRLRHQPLTLCTSSRRAMKSA